MPLARGRFVAVANGRYIDRRNLERAGPDARELAAVLAERHQFEPLILEDLERGALLDALDQALGEDSCRDGSLIVLWIGHGQLGVDGTLRLLGRSASRDVDLASAAQLGEWAARTGARQVLVFLDACFSGGGLVDATRLAQAVNDGRRSAAAFWFGVVAASRGDEQALSGALAQKLQRLLLAGPRQPDFSWDQSRQHIRGDDLVQALLADWDEPRQQPQTISAGMAWDLVCNPRFQLGIPDQPVEHLLLAARGSSGEASFFAGREQPLATLVAWLREARPGLAVVTGPPGCGKSALVGRLVSLSSANERARLLEAGPVAAELDPGQGSISAQLHARGATVDTAAETVAAQLGLDAGGGAYAVLAEARRRRGQNHPLVFAIDGLDEARAFASPLARELLAPLAQLALVLVATRDVPGETSTLIAELGPAAQVLDLGADAGATLRDVATYVRQRLAGASPKMDADLVAAELAGGARTSEAPFLLARLVTSQLREQPVDTSSADWRPLLAASVESALERDLQGVVLEVDGLPHATAARELMQALAFAHGGGFPADDLWPAVATALSPTGSRYGREHAYALIATLGRHLIAGREGDQPVVRVAHQRLVDYLRQSGQRSRTISADESLNRVAAAVHQLYRQLLEAGFAPREHPYLFRHAWRHLGEAGEPGLALLRELAQSLPEVFRPDLALALEAASAEAWMRAQSAQALSWLDQAVSLRREISDRKTLAISLFQLAIFRSSAGDDDGAEAAAREASTLARELPDQPEARATLTAALTALALTQLRSGRYLAAKRLSEEAIAVAEQGGKAEEDLLRPRLAAACLVGAQAATALDEFEVAERLSTRAVELGDAEGGFERARATLLDALSVLAGIQWLLAIRQPTHGNNGPLPREKGAGERILAEFRRRGPEGNLNDLATARGLGSLVRTYLVELELGLPVPAEAERLGIVTDAIELARPLAEEVADAGILLGSLLNLRAELVEYADPNAAAADRAAAQNSLRRFAASSTLASRELGTLLDAEIERRFKRHGGQPDEEVGELIRGHQEAASLLRQSEAWFHRYALADCLQRLAALFQLAGRLEPEVSARAESIEVWRGLLDSVEAAPAQLVVNLAEQAARLLHQRLAEAADLAREAVDRASKLPEDKFSSLLALAESNLAAAELLLGHAEEAAVLFDRAITRLEPLAEEPFFAGLLAVATLNRARLEVNAGHFEAALPLAERAAELFATPDLPPQIAVQEPLARLVLGEALRGVGQKELGAATLRQAIDELCGEVLGGRLLADSLAEALNTGPSELWPEVLERLADRPDLCRRLSLLRRRQGAELTLAIDELSAALAEAPAEETRALRSIVRLQRSHDPPAFDAAWRRIHGELPAWLEQTARAEQLAIAWWNTSTWMLSRDYLLAHPDLLGPQTDIVLEEFALDGDAVELVARHQRLLAVARVEGVEAAYAPLLAENDLAAWHSSGDLEAYFTEHPELRRPEVLALLAERAQEGDLGAAALAALFELVSRGEGTLAFQILKTPASGLGQLRPAWRSKDVSRLAALATLIRGATDEDALKRQAEVALAMARVLAGRDHEVADLLREVAQGATAGELDELRAQLGDTIQHHPSFAGGLARLIAGLSEPSAQSATP